MEITRKKPSDMNIGTHDELRTSGDVVPKKQQREAIWVHSVQCRSGIYDQWLHYANLHINTGTT
ncbi:hypothetical protein YC2023_075047 [Brassica napus]